MYGKYKHTVDPKGRLFVPSKLREELGDAFYVTLGLDHCLSVYTETQQHVHVLKCDGTLTNRKVKCVGLGSPPLQQSQNELVVHRVRNNV